jgi:hypothetical protein
VSKDLTKNLSDGRLGKRASIGPGHLAQDHPLSSRVENLLMLFPFELSNAQRELSTLVEQAQQLQVDPVNLSAQRGQVYPALLPALTAHLTRH